MRSEKHTETRLCRKNIGNLSVKTLSLTLFQNQTLHTILDVSRGTVVGFVALEPFAIIKVVAREASLAGKLLPHDLVATIWTVLLIVVAATTLVAEVVAFQARFAIAVSAVADKAHFTKPPNDFLTSMLS